MDAKTKSPRRNEGFESWECWKPELSPDSVDWFSQLACADQDTAAAGRGDRKQQVDLAILHANRKLAAVRVPRWTYLFSVVDRQGDRAWKGQLVDRLRIQIVDHYRRCAGIDPCEHGDLCTIGRPRESGRIGTELLDADAVLLHKGAIPDEEVSRVGTIINCLQPG